jgi:gamma-butyrobetaine dioxygenase
LFHPSYGTPSSLRTFMPSIHIVNQPASTRVVMHDGTQETELPPLWLRARSPDPTQRDSITGQRLMNPHLLPDDLQVLTARWDDDRLHLSFSDGFAGHFDPQELLEGCVLRTGAPSARPWKAAMQRQPRYAWTDLQDEQVLYRALTDFIELGFLLVHGTPTAPDSILQIAARFGFVRSTNFGSFFEVYSRPDSTDLAYRPVALGPHTDNPYRTPVPGIQILQCLQNETSGGLSTLVDSLAVAEQLRAEDAAGFALLSRIPVRFEYRDASTHLVSVKPMIELDGQGEMTGVHYSPRLDDIPLMSQEDTVAYHRARKRLGTLFEDPAYELRFRLQAGEMMMFDNNRVLHGRTSFDPAEGHRQLQGCYVDRDGPRSLHLVLQRKLGTA